MYLGPLETSMTIPILILGDGKGREYMELSPELVAIGNTLSSLTVERLLIAFLTLSA
jgi:hypothetical protein